MAKLLLCHPVFLSLSPEEQASESPYFPLGLLYLASYVRENGHEVAVFDGTFETDETAFERRLAVEQPDAVGIAALLPNRDMALKLAGMARNAGVPVILDEASAAGMAYDDAVARMCGDERPMRFTELKKKGLLNRLFGGG